MNANEVARAIISANFNSDEIALIQNALKFVRTQKTHANTGSLTNGTAVKFTSGRLGVVKGTVTKVNRKFILVNSGLTTYRVPADMLERI